MILDKSRVLSNAEPPESSLDDGLLPNRNSSRSRPGHECSTCAAMGDLEGTTRGVL